MMRTVLTVGLILAAAACGPTQQDLENAVIVEREKAKQERDAADAARAAQECRENNQRLSADHAEAIADAQTTIRSTLDNVSREESDESGVAAVAFSIRIDEMSPTEWRWVEGEALAAAVYEGTGGISDRIHYTVDPAQLSPAVTIVTHNGMPAVRFNCGSGNCIRAVGRRVLHYNGQDQFEDIDEYRRSNVWAFGTVNRAEVVRDALAELIRRTTTPPQHRDCPEPRS